MIGMYVQAAHTFEGLKDALNNKGKRTSLKGLPISQAGAVRHKDAWKSYNQAYNFGEKLKQ